MLQLACTLLYILRSGWVLPFLLLWALTLPVYAALGAGAAIYTAARRDLYCTRCYCDVHVIYINSRNGMLYSLSYDTYKPNTPSQSTSIESQESTRTICNLYL